MVTIGLDKDVEFIITIAIFSVKRMRETQAKGERERERNGR